MTWMYLEDLLSYFEIASLWLHCTKLKRSDTEYTNIKVHFFPNKNILPARKMTPNSPNLQKAAILAPQVLPISHHDLDTLANRDIYNEASPVT